MSALHTTVPVAAERENLRQELLRRILESERHRNSRQHDQPRRVTLELPASSDSATSG